MSKFQLNNLYPPKGDQPQAVERLVAGYEKYRQQTLLGVTGSGKTFTIANVIQQLQKPTLVLSHNKTLAAQLFQEFQTFFPRNKVCYFVSYYDYYQPESYLPHTDTYIEKDSSVNEKIERLRLEAATSLLARSDVIVVSSVSCIYSFGQPADFEGESFHLTLGQHLTKKDFLKALINIQYERNDTELRSGRFRVRGDTIDILQGSANSNIVRIQLFGDEIEAICDIDRITGRKINDLRDIFIYPAKPFVVPEDRMGPALESIRQELKETLPKLDTIEAYRLNQRTNYDLEMLEQLGYCKGMENYSRHFDNRQPGQPPFTLLDFFEYAAKDWLLVIDESHQTIPQVGGMYHGDKARKKNLVDYGFRLPSAFDNRPLKFSEFEKYLKHAIYVSATPGEYELENSSQVVEQIIRPTGLVDPPIEVRPVDGQVADLHQEISKVVNKGHRVLVTTLTKRMAEDLAAYFVDQKIKAVYLHSEIDTLERTKIIRDLRLGKYDVLVGINLLREGLDLPEVALVAILDADKEGFLRNTTSLIQTIGRAARNVESRVIMYAASQTHSIKEAIRETDRRRKIQTAYNKKHGITPRSIIKAIAEEEVVIEPGERGKELALDKLIVDLEGRMQVAAEDLDFEKAIELRDKIEKLKKKLDD
ncbi:MAG: excinuclease ABC subunit UvrB [Patescibacteria group bacterium]|jgi:excinuclease ABC subunit B|nr:excinuclease ABC subunit UvrB [Patescibacteria group bacterium]